MTSSTITSRWGSACSRPRTDTVKHAKEVARTHVDYRTSHTTIEKFLQKPTEWVVEATDDGYIFLKIGSRGLKAVEVSPYRYAFLEPFNRALGDMIFVLDENDKPGHLVFSGIPVAGTYRKMDVFHQQGFVADLLVVSE